MCIYVCEERARESIYERCFLALVSGVAQMSSEAAIPKLDEVG